MVEIAKALSQRARVLVMDEPTAALSERESDALFALIRQLRVSGVAIVYISHRMQEVFELGDRVTVLRDGRRVATLPAGEATPDQLIGMMVGRAVGAVYKRRQYSAAGKIVLDVRGLTTATGVRDVDLTCEKARSSACPAWSAPDVPRSRARFSAPTPSSQARSISRARSSRADPSGLLRAASR
jgi:ABC-type sugar transport system, ATPase component